jgi:fluoride exporter
MRYYVSLYHEWSKRYTALPVFTLLVNVFGSILNSTLKEVARATHNAIDAFPADSPSTASVFLTALSTGFCGSLTTVSTLMNEIRTNTTGITWVYALVTVFGTQAILLFINGPQVWS